MVAIESHDFRTSGRADGGHDEINSLAREIESLFPVRLQ